MTSQLRKLIAKQIFNASAVSSNNFNFNGLSAAISLQNRKGELPDFHIPLNVLPNFLPSTVDVNQLTRDKYEAPIQTVTINPEQDGNLTVVLENGSIVKDILSNTMRNLDTVWKMNVKFSSIQPQKIVVEFSSPNIAKPFHAGHLRSTIVGNFVANICQAAGHSVQRINYLGDWGSQFGVLSRGYQLFGNEDSLNKDPINHLYEVYVKANQMIAVDKDFEKSTRAECQLLEQGQEPVSSLWRKFRALSVAHLEETYKRLGITFDTYEGESMYCVEAAKVCEKLTKLSTQTDGAKVFHFRHPSGPEREIVLLKRDGSSLYITRDVAAAISRMERYNFGMMYYVVENGQSDHFIALKEILKQTNPTLTDKLRHIRFGRIRGMSTRQGKVVFLDSVLNEARSRALRAMQLTQTTKVFTEMEAVADILGTSAVIINDLKCRRRSDVEFNWEKLLRTKGDTGIFLQYVHARLCSLEENCGVMLNLDCDVSPLFEPEAYELLSLLARYEDVCFDAYESFEAHLLVDFLFKLGHTVNVALKKLTIKGENMEVAQARLLLFMAARKIIDNGMRILGVIKPVGTSETVKALSRKVTMSSFYALNATLRFGSDPFGEPSNGDYEMSFPSLSSISNEWWEVVCSKIDGSVVFIDDEACECLHWSGGLSKLYERGAVEVKEFSSLENALDNQKKVTFLIAAPLWREKLRTLRDIITSSKFDSCLIITSADITVHNLIKYGHQDGSSLASAAQNPFAQLEEQIRSWMGNRHYNAKIIHVPLFLASICPVLFVTPPFAQLFPTLSYRLSKLCSIWKTENPARDKKLAPSDELSNVDFGVLPLELQVVIQEFAVNLNCMLETYSAREECYSLGGFSRIVCSQLELLLAARSRKKSSQNKISVLFIDRTLDLAQSTSFEFETLLDKVLYHLPKIGCQTNDVAVDLSPLCSVETSFGAFVPGSLSHSKDTTCHAILNSMVINKQKESVMEINRQLVEAIAKESIPAGDNSKFGRVSAESLLNLVKIFKNKPEALYNRLGLLQQALATVEALQHVDNSKVESLLGVEKALMQTMAESDSPSCLLKVAQLVKERKTRELSVEDILILLFRLYSLQGCELKTEGDAVDILKAVLGDAVFQDYDHLPEYLKNVVGPELDELTVHAMVTKLFCALLSVAGSRVNLNKFTSTFNPGSAVQPASYVPLLKQILDTVFDPTKPDLVDLECRTSGLKDMLKSGLGLFMSVSKPRPSDGQALLIYVFGGITSTEVRRIRETILAYKPTMQVMIGSTRMAFPKDTLGLLLGNDYWNSQ